MRDAALVFALDTEVVDDPDAENDIAIPVAVPVAFAVEPIVARTGTDGALTMQVEIDGEFHRRTPDLSHTACALKIAAEFNPPRREQLTGRLCPICFTEYERSLAAQAAKGRDL